MVLTQCEPVCEEWERVAVGRWGRDGRPRVRRAPRRVRRAPRRVLGMNASVEAGCQGGVTAGWMKSAGVRSDQPGSGELVRSLTIGS